MTEINDRRILRDYADRRKKLRPHDDGISDVVDDLMMGLVVVAFALFVLWLALGSR